ncbi:protein mono-ADP-ribosyltransferase PARP8-like [Meleagris gallopavo]|uniref:protein mono-ADP-ribosyltransferase PARP8-like n=1 Tax=Meleagris gallopavo TaxID=9103 RepID=UPI0012AB9BFC|nr:protein mono-ADP-ribosyltransferase PARP8-like [Meleagris gallopavo]
MDDEGMGWQSTAGLQHARCFSLVDNTYVSSSDNDEDVLVTTEPIPVIFHQIATELRKTSDVNYCLSIKAKLQRENGEESQHNSTLEEDSEGDNDSEEFYYGGQVSYDGELHKHPQLEADLIAVREIYGPNAVSLRLKSGCAISAE